MVQDGKDESTCSEGLEGPTASSEPLHFLDRGRRNQGFLSSVRPGGRRELGNALSRREYRDRDPL